MTTPPLVNVPTSACFASVVMGINRVVGVTSSPFTLNEQAFKWPGEQWFIELNMPPFNNRKVASDWQAFGMNLEGRFGRFLMGDPLGKVPRGVASGSPKVDGPSQSGNTLVTKDWTPDVTGIMLKGDYIQLGTGVASRLHMVTEDVNSDSSGDAILKIQPALRTSPADSAAIVVNNARGVFRLDSNTWSWSVSPGPVYRMSFRAMEVVDA